MIAIHEDLGTYLAFFGLPDYAGIWFLLYIPLLALTFVLLWQLSPTAAKSGSLVRIGLLLLVFALAAEVLTAGVPAFDRTAHAWPYTVEVAVEEGAELAAWILIATGLADGLRTLGAPTLITEPPDGERERSGLVERPA